MKKLFAIMLIPFFLAPLTVISTEQNIKLANEQKYNLTSNITTGTNYFNELPGVKSSDIKEILNSIDSEKYDYNYLKKFIKKYVNVTGHSCKDIYKLIDK